MKNKTKKLILNIIGSMVVGLAWASIIIAFLER